MRNELETRPRTWVPADPSPAHLPTVVQNNPILPSVAGELVSRGQYTGHARQDDDALTQAQATLLVSAAYIAAAGLITLGLLLLVWLFRGLGERWAVYAYVGLCGPGGPVEQSPAEPTPQPAGDCPARD